MKINMIYSKTYWQPQTEDVGGEDGVCRIMLNGCLNVMHIKNTYMTLSLTHFGQRKQLTLIIKETTGGMASMAHQ